jgi:uncharacterized protein (DUF433 family)
MPATPAELKKSLDIDDIKYKDEFKPHILKLLQQESSTERTQSQTIVHALSHDSFPRDVVMYYELETEQLIRALHEARACKTEGEIAIMKSVASLFFSFLVIYLGRD